MSESALVLTDDEWGSLSSICERWLMGITTRYASIDDECEALARRVIEAASTPRAAQPTEGDDE